MSKWTCSICGYLYDEQVEGIPFSQLPDHWVCPLCGANKEAFVPDSQPKATSTASPEPLPSQLVGDNILTAGELAALCSNLARGCEKQYHEQEAALFRELAAYFEAVIPAPSQEQVELSALLELIQADLRQGYPALHGYAKEIADRGTQRICVWGEKVTRILESLLRRYQREGDAFLKDTQVWVCSVCGFVYVGDDAPALCPVCKVPAWKFEKMEGRR